MLSFTSYIFSVITMGGTTGLYVTGLYVLFCWDCLPIAGLEIKRRMAFIVNRSDTRTAREELPFSTERGNSFTKTYSNAALLMLLLPLQEKPYLGTDNDG